MSEIRLALVRPAYDVATYTPCGFDRRARGLCGGPCFFSCVAEGSASLNRHRRDTRDPAEIDNASHGGRPAQPKPAYTVIDLVARITPDNLQREIHYGPARGRESW